MTDKKFKVGITAGAFTLLTAGHIHLFEVAKQSCDHLIVLTNTDDFIRNKKDCTPVPIEERLEILKSIRFIDEVSFFKGSNEHKWIKDFAIHSLKQRFGSTAELYIYHSQEEFNKLKQDSSYKYPGIGYAQPVFLEKFPRTSVSDIFNTIRGKNV